MFTTKTLSKDYSYILYHLKYMLSIMVCRFSTMAGAPLKCIPSFLNSWLAGRNRWWPIYTTFLQCFKYMLSMSSKQWVHAWYPLFVYPERLLSAGQSLIVMNNNAHRSKLSCLSSSHTHTPSFFQSSKSSSTNGLRYTSIFSEVYGESPPLLQYQKIMVQQKIFESTYSGWIS